MGQIIPHSITIGKKLPIAMYVADLSLSTEQETTKPTKNDDEYVKYSLIQTLFMKRLGGF